MIELNDHYMTLKGEGHCDLGFMSKSSQNSTFFFDLLENGVNDFLNFLIFVVFDEYY
jgi:hypothetical protein